MKISILITFLFISCYGCPTTVDPPPENNKANLRVIWESPIDIIDTPDTPPLVVDSQILITGEPALVAFNMNTGNRVWETEIGNGKSINGNVLVHDSINNRVFAAHNKSVIIWDINTGQELNRINEIAWPFGNNVMLDNGYGIVGDTASAYKLDFSGNIIQEYDVSMPSNSIAYYNGNILFTQGKTLNGASTIGRVTAISEETGDSLWSYNTNNNGFLKSEIHDGIFYSGTSGNSDFYLFIAIDPISGEILWEYLSNHPLEYVENFTIGDANIFVVSAAYLFALNKRTGTKEWVFQWNSASRVNPIYSSGYIYISNHYSIFIIDAKSGELVHEEPLPQGAGYFWMFAMSEDMFFAQTSTKLIAYQPWHLRE